MNASELGDLAGEIREMIIDAVSKNGGHLASSLGVVELTLALHYVFNTPTDRLIWDVGHQAYPHKILTGRRDRIRTLRMGGGLSGFTKRTESEYDPFGAAHSSTSISAALGFAIANKLADKPGKYVADIYELGRQRLCAAGVAHVYGGGLCTVSAPDRFFSYRRDGQTGRMAAFIWLE